MKLLQNPFVKIIGIIVIIYFALFSNKNNPASLGNRLSGERIKQNLSEAQEKGKFIASNIKTARELSKEPVLPSQDAATQVADAGNVAPDVSQIAPENNAQEQVAKKNVEPAAVEISEVITSKDIKLGQGKRMALCGSEVEISTNLKSAAGKIVDVKKSEKLILGDHKNDLLEKNILNMKEGGIREIKLPKDFKTSDKKLSQALQQNNSDLFYQITLIKTAQHSAVGKVYRCE